jgi:hypothetical protein
VHEISDRADPKPVASYSGELPGGCGVARLEHVPRGATDGDLAAQRLVAAGSRSWRFSSVHRCASGRDASAWSASRNALSVMVFAVAAAHGSYAMNPGGRPMIAKSGRAAV